MSSYASSQKSGKEGRSRPLTRPPNVMVHRSGSLSSFDSSTSSSSSSSLPSYGQHQNDEPANDDLHLPRSRRPHGLRRLPEVPAVPTSPTPSYSSSRSSSPHARTPPIRTSSASSTTVSSISRPSSTAPSIASRRPLPKTPSSAPGRLSVAPQTNTGPSRPSHHARSASSPPMSPADSLISFMLPQRPTDIKDLRRGNLSKLRRHLGQSVPADLVLPPIETDDDEDDDDDNDEYDSSETDSDDSHAKKRMGMAGLSFATLAELSQAISPLLPNPPDEASIKRQSRKWLREKKGKRWEEDDYEGILQSLRTLR